MFEHTQPAPLDDGGDDFAEFRVDAPREVQALLRRLLDAGADLFLSAPNGAHLRTTLWTLDTGRGLLSFAADDGDPQLLRLVDAGEAVAVGYLDHVKLQFDVDAPLLVHGAQASALQARVPGRLYRFQRRQSYRVRLPERSGASAVLHHPGLPEMQLTLRVLDISIGGCALLVPPDVPPLPPGTRVPGVHLQLDALTRLDATLVLQHVTSLAGDAAGARVGCALHDLDGQAQRVLQRHIDQAQKRKRLLSID
jgi:c-di-GMP-binding flagellar brake protein YcgR